MRNQNILALALKPAMRVTKSFRIGIALLLAATLIAMITPAAARAAAPRRARLPPRGGPTRHSASDGLGGGCQGQHHRPRWCVVRYRRRCRQDLARRSPDRGANAIRQRAAAR